MTHDTESGIELMALIALTPIFSDLPIGSIFLAEEGDAYEKVSANVASLLISPDCEAMFAASEPVKPVTLKQPSDPDEPPIIEEHS